MNETKITIDSVTAIAKTKYPGKRIVVELENNYDPSNTNKLIRHYWTVKQSEDLNKNEYQFIQIDLTTGEIEGYIFKRNYIN